MLCVIMLSFRSIHGLDEGKSNCDDGCHYGYSCTDLCSTTDHNFIHYFNLEPKELVSVTLQNKQIIKLRISCEWCAEKENSINFADSLSILSL